MLFSRPTHYANTLTGTIATLLTLAFSVTPAGAAGPCLGNITVTPGRYAIVGAPMVCTTANTTAKTLIGTQVTTCRNQSGGFRARWLSETARLNDSAGGCVFMCGANECFVGNDALPVELLQFGVE